MNTRRLTRTALGLLATLSVGVAGCAAQGSPDPTASGSATPSVGATASASGSSSALDELTAAAQKLNDDTVKVTTEMTGLTGNGNLDPARNQARMTMELATEGQPVTAEILVTGSDAYVKLAGAPNVQNKWMHVDVARLAGGNFDIMPQGDPAGANKMIKSMAAVERTGEGSFRGTLDLTKAPTINTAVLSGLGDKAKAVPFTAAVDNQGRLTRLQIELTAIAPSLGTLSTTYSDFGAPVTVTRPPAAETVEAPESLPGLFGR
ncbi:hypothetical protein SAMN05444365_101195 [Micromonospora pattaloongensis]|uniref:Lipoprotein LprG n=1 Tax=Micromonospora pattaloongensis TaxID=405436 RepID=A0A1H3FX83_9ACTN|nr:hypothetical protein [Micromonospora pattaloongensis]SDX95576.1 hypothetical protein SAMN05444365_101195 [Micromonospora pattaloongensis]